LYAIYLPVEVSHLRSDRLTTLIEVGSDDHWLLATFMTLLSDETFEAVVYSISHLGGLLQSGGPFHSV
jgi:DNA-directed RNA polymerase subunit L